jgi:hypothetical protein
VPLFYIPQIISYSLHKGLGPYRLHKGMGALLP